MFYEQFSILCNEIGTTPTNFTTNVLKLSSSKVTAWKNGSIPKYDVLKEIADYFHVTIGELFDGRRNVSIENTITTGDIQGDHNANINSHDSNNEYEKEISSILSGLTVREKTELMTMIYKFSDEHKK